MKKVLSILALMVISAVMLFARGKKELVNAGSWVYDAMAAISNECGIVDFSDRAPLSIEELEFYMEKYDYDSLSPAGKKLYDKRESIKKEQAMRDVRRAMSFRRK